MMKFIAACLFLLSSIAQAKPLALVYSGPGVCEEACASTFKDALPNYNVKLVTNADYSPTLFKNAGIWVQPGGYATNEVQGMSSDLKAGIKNFVANGGGYLGFCAGAFSATQYVGKTNVLGLNLIPGYTALWGTGTEMEKINWAGTPRYIYWEGGPYFYGLPESVEVVAYYPNGSPAAVRSTYGKGRVFLSGVHPEAPAFWRNDPDMNDPDGLDFDLVQAMAAWAIAQ